MKKKSILLIFLIVFISITVYSQNESVKKIGTDIKKDKIDISDFSKETPISLINFFMALSFVIGLIFLSTYFLKKLTGIKTSGLRGQAVKMNIISNLPLGDKKFLLIVEIQEKHHFIGVTPTSISYMSELTLDKGSLKSETNEDEFKSILDKAKTLLSGNKK